jgi:hypothetical protein
MNNEIKEILQYLESRNDYIIWAGFAQFAHLGTKCSADIDIFTDKPETKEKISADFQKNGWKTVPHDNTYLIWDKLEKNGTTFDIVYSQPASKLLFSDVAKIEVYGHKIRFLSKEGLFITKLGQLTWENRTEKKCKRDLETIISLKKLIDVKKINELIKKLPDSFWKTGKI